MWDVRVCFILAGLVMEVLTCMATLHEFARHIIHKAEDNFLALW
jgi:hypothetical protein